MLYRVCPKCMHQWESRYAFLNDTTKVGVERRQVPLYSPLRVPRCAIIYVTVYRHNDCGGEMVVDGR